MKRYIVVSPEVEQKMMKAYNVGAKSVYNALNYDVNRGHTELARRLREFAFKNGGVEMVDGIVEMETIHFADGTMRQSLGRGVVMTLTRDGLVRIERRGTLVKTMQAPRLIEDYERLQREAAAIAGVEKVTVLR